MNDKTIKPSSKDSLRQRHGLRASDLEDSNYERLQAEESNTIEGISGLMTNENDVSGSSGKWKKANSSINLNNAQANMIDSRDLQAKNPISHKS